MAHTKVYLLIEWNELFACIKVVEANENQDTAIGALGGTVQGSALRVVINSRIETTIELINKDLPEAKLLWAKRFSPLQQNVFKGM